MSVSRRKMIGLGGAGLVAGAAAGVGALKLGEPRVAQASPAGGPVAFHGTHQAGIATPVQDRLHFAAFDVTTNSRDRLIALLKDWTAAAARMTSGGQVGGGAYGGVPLAPPDDTGEALGLPPSRLTITIGFGPSLFARKGLGLAPRKPAALVALPHFPGDSLDPAASGGDLCIQACSDDPQVAVHAVRNLARIGFGTVAVRWSQLGFGKTSSTTPSAQTPRNLMGFLDGTNNISGTDAVALDQHVWVSAADGPPWLAGGSYLVARRIRMRIEIWDRTSLTEQEDIIGRTKGEGAPYGAVRERDPVDLSKLPADSHVRLINPAAVGGVKILRRGYSFTDGSDGLGKLDAGLFFICYQRDPARGFIPLQRVLAAKDPLNEYINHVGSGLWACPPGVQRGGFWGDTLFA